jgi:hypothetical protein
MYNLWTKLYIIIVTVFIIILLMPNSPLYGDNLGNMVLDIVECSINLRSRTPHISSSGNHSITSFYHCIENELRQSVEFEGHIEMQIFLKTRSIFGIQSLVPTRWQYNYDDSEYYWEKHKASLRSAMLKACEPTKCPDLDVAIHMRLGDVPFQDLYQPNSVYHFQYGKYFTWAFQRLGITTSDVITLVYSVVWRSDEKVKQLSQEYIDVFCQWLKDNGYTVQLQSEDSLTDIASLVKSKRFIGSCGSYSFISAIGRDSMTFCLPQLGMELKDGKYALPYRPSWMSPHPPLLHHTVQGLHMEYDDIQLLAQVLFE